jgi:hypothetical protein
VKKEVLVTPEQITKVIHEITTGKRLEPIMKKAPVLSLAFTLFGAEMMRILFDIKEETK